MGRITSYPYLNSLDFALCEFGYVSLRKQTFRNVTVPKGFIFDGVTVKAPFTMLFSQKNLRNGVRASCFHDFMCEHKNKFKRREATKVLCEIWQDDGLGKVKATLVFACVEFYQFLKGWR
ncbi:MAG: DUF1353 domain-containing protein [Alphaproteobacteria bacterium]|nr:DUF1353 domain-containing protein [Alphaproteobacteria bacterium]